MNVAGSQINVGAMHTLVTWHRNHAKRANADDLRSRPNKVAQINVCALNIPTFILPDYTYLPTHNSAPGQIHTTSNMTYPGTMAGPQVIPGYDLRPERGVACTRRRRHGRPPAVGWQPPPARALTRANKAPAPSVCHRNALSVDAFSAARSDRSNWI